jgi:polyhydroxyalkanoate synthesis regulator phasin
MTLAEIRDRLDEISEEWRSHTAAEQKTTLKDLDDLLDELDVLETDVSAATDTVEELRGRIEILMDEIDIGLGIEPAPITGLAEMDIDPGEEPSDGQ